jgi:acetolactate synthase-1/2/3 large subunit
MVQGIPAVNNNARFNRGADALARALATAGVKRIFTLSGNHVMPVFDACLAADIELIHVRHEAAAVHMADAWGRLTGETGVALVTGGPGHANAVSALYTAAMAESPVLLLSGHAPLNQLGMGAFQEMRQADVAAPLVKWAGTADQADRLANDAMGAMALARAGRPGPVHLSLPTDVLEAECEPARAGARSVAATAAALPAAALAVHRARAIVGVLARAQRPLIVVGPAGCTRAGRLRAAALEQALGMPVVCTESPRGIGDPALGAFAEMLALADRVLLLGKRLDFTLKFGQAPAWNGKSLVLQIDPEEQELERSRNAVGARLHDAVRADLFPAMDALIAAAQAVSDTTPPVAPASRAKWMREVHDAVAYRPAAWRSATSALPGRLHPAQAMAPLQTLLDSHPDAVLVSDGGEIGQWAQACLRAPERVINGVAGSIGAALPFALAARLARPEAPVVAVMGDGTFGFHCAEIDTAVRHGLAFVAVVGNDARWNAEYQIQLRQYGKDRLVGCELLPTRYDAVTAAFGGHGEFVTAAADLPQAVERARASGLPACVNVMIEGLAAPNVTREAKAPA